MFKKLLLSLLITVPVITQAEWIEVGSDSEFTTYLDPARLVATDENSQQLEFWIKNVVHTDLSKDGLGVGDHRLIKYGVKCRQSEMALMAGYFYSKGKLINSHVSSYNRYEPVIPDSIGENYLNLVCAIVYSEE